MPNGDYESIIKQTRDKLEETPEWRDRYLRYAKEINKNLGLISSVRTTFHERPPLNLYINISSAKVARKAVNFELRYRGQSVARLTGNETTSPRLTTSHYVNTVINSLQTKQ
jgi:hypothetical protein